MAELKGHLYQCAIDREGETALESSTTLASPPMAGIPTTISKTFTRGGRDRAMRSGGGSRTLELASVRRASRAAFITRHFCPATNLRSGFYKSNYHGSHQHHRRKNIYV